MKETFSTYIIPTVVSLRHARSSFIDQQGFVAQRLERQSHPE